MSTFSTRDAAKRLGIDMSTLSRYMTLKKVPEPKSVTSGGMTIHLWTEEEIEHVRKLLPKIANGRKTRYKKKYSAVSSQQSAKTTAPARAHKQRKTKKKSRTTKPPKAHG